VSAGLGGYAFDSLVDRQEGFENRLKPIQVKRVIMVTPLASVPAVDRMHVLADEIFCLSVIQDYISTDHYYDKQDVPDHELVVKTIEQIVGHWQ